MSQRERGKGGREGRRREQVSQRERGEGGKGVEREGGKERTSEQRRERAGRGSIP